MSVYDDVRLLDPERPVPRSSLVDIGSFSTTQRDPAHTSTVDKQCQSQTTYIALRKASRPQFQLTVVHSRLGIYDGRGCVLPEQQRAPAVEAEPPALQDCGVAAPGPSWGASGPGGLLGPLGGPVNFRSVHTSSAAGARRLASG